MTTRTTTSIGATTAILRRTARSLAAPLARHAAHRSSKFADSDDAVNGGAAGGAGTQKSGRVEPREAARGAPCALRAGATSPRPPISPAWRRFLFRSHSLAPQAIVRRRRRFPLLRHHGRQGACAPGLGGSRLNGVSLPIRHTRNGGVVCRLHRGGGSPSDRGGDPRPLRDGRGGPRVASVCAADMTLDGRRARVLEAGGSLKCSQRGSQPHAPNAKESRP